MRADQNTPLQVTAQLPDEEDMRSLALDVRKLILDNEPANFRRVNRIIGGIDDTEVRTGNGVILENWKTNLAGSIAFTVNQTPLQGEALLQAWLNGVAFHDTDLEARPFFEAVASSPIGPMIRADIDGMILGALAVAVQQANLINHVLKGDYQLPWASELTEQDKEQTG